MGARAHGMANAASCIGDEWALLNNVGGLSKVNALTVAFSKYAIPSFKPFNRIAAVFSVPVKFGVAGMGFYRFGDDLYNEQVVSIGYSTQLGIASLGIKLSYIQYHAEGFGTTSGLAFSFGGIAEITPAFLIGAYAENINQPMLSSGIDERIPARFKVGTGFRLSDKVFATAELQKEVTDSPIVRAGVEYQVHKKFSARTGFNLNPQSAFGGLGFKLRKFKLDYAIQFHEQLGAAHQASVIATLPKKK